MNYIKKLQLENQQLQSRAETTGAMITNLAAYLTSSKFHEDTTVQTKDVLNRLEEVRSHLNGTHAG